MSVLIFELKEEHIKLLKHLRWSLLDNKFLVSTEDTSEDPAPFGENSIYEGMDLILNGKPSNFDPFNTSEETIYSLEQTDEWDKLMIELPTALEIILHNSHFELGTYKCRYHDRQWKKVNKYEI